MFIYYFALFVLKRAEMIKIEIYVRRRDAVILSALLVLVALGLGVTAFGGSNPAVLGHSAGELIVNSTSVVDNSLTGDDILESSLGTVPSATSASTASYASESASCGNGGSGDDSCEMRSFTVNNPSGGIIAQIGSSSVVSALLRISAPTSPTLQFETTSGGSTTRSVSYSNPGDLLDLGTNVRFTTLSNTGGSFAISVNDLTLDDNTAAGSRVLCWLNTAGAIGRCADAMNSSGQCSCINS